MDDQSVERLINRKRLTWCVVALIMLALGFACGKASASVNDRSIEEYLAIPRCMNISPTNLRKIERDTNPLLGTISRYSLDKYTLEEVRYTANKYCGIIIGAEQVRGKVFVFVEWQSPSANFKAQVMDYETKERALISSSNKKGK
jgi:hypothetical protein